MSAPASLTPRQQLIVDLLASGPRRTDELVSACGYEARQLAGHHYVLKTLSRLAGRYPLRRIGRPGNRSLLWVLLPSPEAGSRRCWRCGHLLASDHRGAVECSPCERSRVEAELAQVAV